MVLGYDTSTLNHTLLTNKGYSLPDLREIYMEFAMLPLDFTAFQSATISSCHIIGCKVDNAMPLFLAYTYSG